jgi:hypothetical protein
MNMKDENKKGPLVVIAAVIGAAVASGIMAVFSDPDKRKKAVKVIKKTVTEGEKTLGNVRKTLEGMPDIDNVREEVGEVVEDVKKTIKKKMS